MIGLKRIFMEVVLPEFSVETNENKRSKRIEVHVWRFAGQHGREKRQGKKKRGRRATGLGAEVAAIHQLLEKIHKESEEGDQGLAWWGGCPRE